MMSKFPFAVNRHRGLAAACRLGAALLTLSVVWYLAATPWPVLLAKGGLGHFNSPWLLDKGAWQRGTLMVLCMLPVVLMAYALWQAAHCFVRFGQAEYFTANVIRHLRLTTLGLMLAALAGLLLPSIASLLLSTAMPPGQRSLLVNVGSPQLLLLFFSALLWQITSVMERAVALSEENQQFV